MSDLPSTKKALGMNVFDAAVERMVSMYEAGHRVIVSFSAGKDSGVCLEICVIAAQMTGRLPVEVVMRDEEIMFPGTFEYAERTAARPDIDFHWLIAGQPVINIFNRERPYFWVFDDRLRPEEWVRQPPDFAERIDSKNIEEMAGPGRYPPAEGKLVINVIGLRTQESPRRKFAIHSAKGFLTKPKKGSAHAFPIYDWKDGDVWKGVFDYKWDYNHAYDQMARLGVSRHHLRIAPPTMTVAGVQELGMAAQAWPQWFDRVSERLPGVRSAAMFGRRAVTPQRLLGETWQECFHRVNIEEAPDWIADRCREVVRRYVAAHTNHSADPFPQAVPCASCGGGVSIASWKLLTKAMWNGDPFAMKTDKIGMKYVEPEFFREGAGTWGGKPSF